jgi:hypothetical protein
MTACRTVCLDLIRRISTNGCTKDAARAKTQCTCATHQHKKISIAIRRWKDNREPRILVPIFLHIIRIGVDSFIASAILPTIRSAPPQTNAAASLCCILFDCAPCNLGKPSSIKSTASRLKQREISAGGSCEKARQRSNVFPHVLKSTPFTARALMTIDNLVAFYAPLKIQVGERLSHDVNIGPPRPPRTSDGPSVSAPFILWPP